MKVYWQKLVFKIFFWLLVESVFGAMGIDDLADYSEFLLMPKVIVTAQSSRIVAA